MLNIFLKRFFKKPPGNSGTKIVVNKSLGVKFKEYQIKVNKFIEFKHYTGNEILFSLKNCEKLHPGEISSAIMQLGTRKGIPSTYDWNGHPIIQKTLKLIKERAHQYPCRVLTSLAHGLNRLRINDQKIWELLAVNIIKNITTIDPTGIANTLHAYKERTSPELVETLIEVLPVHLKFMEPKDFLILIKGLSSTETGFEETFAKHLYPYITEKLNSFTITDTTQCLNVLKHRKDLDPGLHQTIENKINTKLSKIGSIAFGGINPKPLIT